MIFELLFIMFILIIYEMYRKFNYSDHKIEIKYDNKNTEGFDENDPDYNIVISEEYIEAWEDIRLYAEYLEDKIYDLRKVIKKYKQFQKSKI